LKNVKDTDIDLQEVKDLEQQKNCPLSSIQLYKDLKDRLYHYEQNTLRKDYIEKYLENKNNKTKTDSIDCLPLQTKRPKFTIEVKVYDSVKRSLFHIIRLRNDNTLKDLTNSICCVSSKIEPIKYLKFFFLEDEIYQETPKKEGKIGMTDNIISTFNKKHPEKRIKNVKPIEETYISD